MGEMTGDGREAPEEDRRLDDLIRHGAPEPPDAARIRRIMEAILRERERILSRRRRRAQRAAWAAAAPIAIATAGFLIFRAPMSEPRKAPSRIAGKEPARASPSHDPRARLAGMVESALRDLGAKSGRARRRAGERAARRLRRHASQGIEILRSAGSRDPGRLPAAIAILAAMREPAADDAIVDLIDGAGRSESCDEALRVIADLGGRRAQGPLARLARSDAAGPSAVAILSERSPALAEIRTPEAVRVLVRIRTGLQGPSPPPDRRRRSGGRPAALEGLVDAV